MTLVIPHVRPRRSWILPIGLWVAASLPAVWAMVALMRVGYWPTGDDALMGLSVHDVLSGHPPVMGPRTTTESLTAVTSHHPGPALAYLYALPVGLLGGGLTALLLATTLLSCAVCAGIVWAAHRVGGVSLAVLAVLATMAVDWALGLQILVRPFNPYPPVLMTILLALLGWGILRLDWAMLPLFVGVACVMVQAHLSYGVFVGVAVLVPALLAGGKRVVTKRRRARLRSHVGRAHILWAIAVAAVVCAPPLVEVFTFHPNNPTQLWRYVESVRGDSSIGLWRAVRFVLSMLVPLPGGFEAHADGWGGAPDNGRHMGMEVLGAILAARLCWIAWGRYRTHSRARRSVRVGARAAALALCGAVAVVAVLPSSDALEPWNYLQVWPSVAVAWVVLASACLAWGRERVQNAASGRSSHGSSWGLRRWTGIQAVTGGIVVAVAALCAGASPASALPSHDGRGIGDAVAKVQQELVRNRSPWGTAIAVRVEGDSFTALLFTAPAIAYGLTLKEDRTFLQRWPSGPEDIDFRNLQSAPDDAATVLVHEVVKGHPVAERFRTDGHRVRRLHDGDRTLEVYLIPAP